MREASSRGSGCGEALEDSEGSFPHPTFRISIRLTVLGPTVPRGIQLDREKCHCQSMLYMTGKKIIFFSRELRSFSKIVERSFVGSNEPVNLCKFQGSSFDVFFGGGIFQSSSGPKRWEEGRFRGAGRAPGLEASEECGAPTQRWGEGHSRGCAARRALRQAKSMLHRPNAGGKAARGAAPRAGP